MAEHRDSIIVLVDRIIRDALQKRASDIHAEPSEHGLRVRFRIDGVLYDQLLVPVDTMHHVISRIKVLANIDIAEKRIPHDGKFSSTFGSRTVDFRVSTFPTRCAEKVVIRILDRSRTMISLESLGLSSTMHHQVLDLITKKSGLFLVTGPTGSGKTTTLYATLLHVNSPDKHIITLEDPVEYHVTGITQGHIQVSTGFSFAKGLRALLRQDPDVVMIGEMRDTETAGIALEAALTGHLVMSTLHTADAPSVIMRLMDMGMEPFLINAAVSGVLAQRLARLLCPQCKVARDLTKQEQLFVAQAGYELHVVYEATGCLNCSGYGYMGRIGIFELMVMTPALRDLVVHNRSYDSLRTCALQQDMKTMLDDGFEKVKQGLISLDELIKAIV